MRPEMHEYDYDWLMGSVLRAASRVGNGTQKEIDLTYNYIPYFTGAAKTFIGAGDVGVQVLKLFDKYYENILTAKQKGKKVAAITFCLSPAILYAMDIVPICTELLSALGNIVWRRGMFDYLDHGCEIGLPETSCSSQRGALGAYLGGLGQPIDFVVCDTPGVCDTNANAFSFASAYMDKPFYQLNYPNVLNDERASDYHIADYKELVKFLEEQTGTKLDYDRLGEVLKEIEKQDELIADLEDMYTLKPCPLPPLFSMAVYAGRFTFAGHKEYTELLETMVKTAKSIAATGITPLAAGKENLRAYLFYIDHYTLDMNFWNWFGERGIAHMGGILSRSFRDNHEYAFKVEGSSYGMDRSSPEKMLDTLAAMNARMPMIRSIRGPYDAPNMWLEESIAMAEHLCADCMIYNGTPGCRNTWANVKLIVRDLEKYGYPVHVMYDDAFDDRVESWESTKERLDEFFKVRGLL